MEHKTTVQEQHTLKQEQHTNKQINNLIDEILQVFVPVFISKEIDSLNPVRYNSSNLKTREDNT